MSHVTAGGNSQPQQLTDFACRTIKTVSVAGRYLRLLSISFTDSYGKTDAVSEFNGAAALQPRKFSDLRFEI
jgi:hypothetical protein